MNLSDYQLMVLDFETFYDTDYTLRKLSTTAYVFDPRFEVIGVGVRFGANRVWMEEHQFRAFAKTVDWSKVALICHHAQFDGLVLSHHYGVHPGFWLDTLSMARAIHGESKAADLGSLMQYYGVGTKGTEVVQAKGKRRVDFTAEEYAQYGVYCIGDCDGTLGIFLKMIRGYPVSELELIDITVRMYTNPVLKLDEPKMQEYLAWEIARKEDLLARIGADKKDLSSADKFANMLRSLGVDPPMKASPTAKQPNGEPKQIYAFAKTDPAFQELLLGSENDDIRWLCEARQGVKSVGNETRSARLLDMGRDGRSLPVYLKYSGAGTFRWSGGDKCLAGDTEINVLRCGAVLCIVLSQLLSDDLVWDGEEFVVHGGLVYQGVREVITYGGITGTKDHKVYCTHSSDPVTLEAARESGYVLEPGRVTPGMETT